jgi:four helix bundle protein
MYMEKKNPYHFAKPYDLRERLFDYACAIVRLTQFLHKQDAVAREHAGQILRAGNSAGANYEEADDGSSKADTRVKRRISLRELKEALFRLRVLRATGYLTEEHEPVIEETLELKSESWPPSYASQSQTNSPSKSLGFGSLGVLGVGRLGVNWRLGVV